jgi:hypothetical protein
MTNPTRSRMRGRCGRVRHRWEFCRRWSIWWRALSRGLRRRFFPRPAGALSRIRVSGHHQRVDGWHRCNCFEPRFTSECSYDLYERTQGRAVAALKIPQGTHANACASGECRLVKIPVKSQRFQAVAQFDFPFFNGPIARHWLFPSCSDSRSNVFFIIGNFLPIKRKNSV